MSESEIVKTVKVMELAFFPQIEIQFEINYTQLLMRKLYALQANTSYFETTNMYSDVSLLDSYTEKSVLKTFGIAKEEPDKKYKHTHSFS